MSILDKKFIYDLINQPPHFSNYDEYSEYLWNNFKCILNNCVMLLHSCGYNRDLDMSAFVLYKYDDKYILIEVFVGTCEGCFKEEDGLVFNDYINGAIDKCYITTNLDDMKQYFKKRIIHEEDEDDLTDFDKNEFCSFIDAL